VTTVFLVRHGTYDRIDHVLVGRTPGVGLSRLGHEQARRVAGRLMVEHVTCVQSSPQLRARETALPLAKAVGLPIEIVPAMNELDVGEWMGSPFAQLERDRRWRSWNEQRGSARPPGGESMAELQRRVLRHIERVRTMHPDGRVVIASHGEPIRAAILHYRGLTLDDFLRVVVDPASVTTLRLQPDGTEIISLNEPAPAPVPA
jgi:probable phosphoglycerate mutase